MKNNMGTNYRISKFNELNSLTLNERVKDKKQRAFKGASLKDKVKFQKELKSIRVDFHCRVIFKSINKIEAMYERSRVNAKVEPRSTLPLSATLYTLPLFHLSA